VDTIAGNLVVLPSPAYQVVGNVDTRFVHLGGDIDYGHRAVTAGLPLYLAPSDVAACRRNFAAVTYVDPGESMLSGCERSSAQKRISLSGGIAMMRSHAGRSWVVFFFGATRARTGRLQGAGIAARRLARICEKVV
jgi:hypothetical protein